jgi:L-threonylcarbamoyladenylate synthase
MTGQRRIDLAALAPAESLGLTAAIATARLMCFPTDTVYGVGGVLGEAAAMAIASAKGRAADKPLQVIFPTREVLLQTVSLSPLLRAVAHRLLPGPVTLLLPFPDGFPAAARGTVAHTFKGGFGRRAHTETIAALGVRVPRWPRAARVLEALPFPLLGSSANLSGEEAPHSLDEVAASVLAACDLILDGGAVDGSASTVVDFTGFERDRSWRILRPGVWGEAEISEMLARKREDLPRP